MSFRSSKSKPYSEITDEKIITINNLIDYLKDKKSKLQKECIHHFEEISCSWYEDEYGSLTQDSTTIFHYHCTKCGRLEDVERK